MLQQHRDILHCPQPIGDPSLDRGRAPKRLVNADVVKRERVSQVRDLLGEGVCEASNRRMDVRIVGWQPYRRVRLRIVEPIWNLPRLVLAECQASFRTFQLALVMSDQRFPCCVSRPPRSRVGW